MCIRDSTETYTAAAGQNGSIDQAAAKAAALSAFGLSEDQAEGIVVIPSYDDGRFVYKVKFWAGSTEYFCAVDGSGQILKSEKAVSYTHLDVYKRQFPFSARRLNHTTAAPPTKRPAP